MQILTRKNEQGGLDVKFLNLDFQQTVALRNAFSSVAVNRTYAQQYGESIMDEIRKNGALSEVHEEFKTSIRDVEPEFEDNDEDVVSDDDDGWE